jgi:hypothetical protein
MDIDSLLKQIIDISRHYEEIAQITGENFNIFNILDKGSREKIHSNFIAMLLDPKGVHGNGNIFLKYFLETIGQRESRKDMSEFPIENIEVQTEYSIGQIDEDQEHGGRIDIVITNRKDSIYIENKIYAEDQRGQLYRYRKHNENAKMIYLTLNGREPGSDTTKDLDKSNFICLSYKHDILSWLEKCRKETVSNPFLRESINQYILLVKQLTGQARSVQMNNDILACITKNRENIATYFKLSIFNEKDVIKYLIENKVKSDLDVVAEKYDLESELYGKFNEEEYGFNFYKNEWKHLSIRFAFGVNINDLQYGVWYEDDKKGKWLLPKGWDHLKPMDTPLSKNWNNIEAFEELCSPDNDIIREIDNKIGTLVPLVDDMNEDTQTG